MSRIRLLLLRPRPRLSNPSSRPIRQFQRQFPRSTHTHTHAPPLLQSRIRWTYFWYASILALGITTGLSARHFAGPLGLPDPGSREDALILESLSRDIDNLSIVTSLRSQSYNLHTDTALSSGPGLSGSAKSGSGTGRKISAYKGWLELPMDLGRDGEASNGALGVMSGTRGLGVQRAFWNAETREMVVVVWMGGALNGWPGVTHGGTIATVFEEVMSRMVKGPEGDVEPKHRPSSLSITYAKPTYTLDFYILRASFSKPESTQLAPPPELEAESTKGWLSWLSPSKDLTKIREGMPREEIVGTLESVKGDLCVKAKGTFGGR